MRTITRGHALGDTGLFSWDRAAPVARVVDEHRLTVGRNAGKLYRTVEVSSSAGVASYSFVVTDAGEAI